MSNEKVLIICLDSFRFDYLEQTRFLKKLAEENQYGKLETILGFSGIGTTLLTGKMPNEHGVWTEFCHAPKTSPFKLFGLFQSLDNTILEKSARLLASVFINGLRYLSGNNYFFKLHSIPFEIIANFDTSLKKTWVDTHFEKFPTFFEILKKKKIPYLCFDWPVKVDNQGWSLDSLTGNNDANKVNSLLKNIDRAQVFWLRLWDLDTTAHKFGTKSRQVKDELQRLDGLCEKLINTIDRNYALKFLFWADHGMVDVKKTIDVDNKVKDLNVLLFLDSTLARFWVKDPRTKSQLLRRLKSFKKYGHILSEKEKRFYHLNFSDNRYGDLFFLTNPGVLIFPNFYQKEKPPRAMHGYDPQYPDQKGIYILSSSKNRYENKNMAQLYEELIKLSIPITSG
jgi:predicted AlkP superfamily pyrophosphatase or phosphodiesterase